MSDTIAPAAPVREQPKYADETTPLVRNCWYVAALSEDITRELRERTIAQDVIVMYRAADGRAVALQNRCAHRSFPLSKGYLEGDMVVCGYHGLTYDSSGVCVRAPMLKNAPTYVRIRSYPIVERPPLVWIWMGDPQRADEALIPEHRWLSDPRWKSVGGYYHVGASYVPLHENLLDLTHFTYLHADNIGTPEYVSAPFEVTTEGNKVRIVRRVDNAAPPPIYGVPMKLEDKRVNRVSDSWFMSPAFHVAFASIKNLEAAEGERSDYHVNILHLLTPQTQDSVHYFWFISRDFRLDDVSAGKWLKDSAVKAFQEDKDALEWTSALIQRESRRPFTEASFASDRAGLAMRKVIRTLAEAEAARTA
jgi:phenylpropionate dioxygenase-like ring-hydroxylating dioxygenase large terminal subunit